MTLIHHLQFTVYSPLTTFSELRPVLYKWRRARRAPKLLVSILSYLHRCYGNMVFIIYASYLDIYYLHFFIWI